ncbi:hypothetical protein SVI_1886 [Shewanella violacea DSS12]|uniref:Uncharacterized protein n=1 Tax=Shewanella violacea (strain JCM 10179 / CIP 106290 / LMG 19151 / DSS12) TaxID=637905 RepID=D4ZJK8_SHEVD|nr:hypothetical protein SVI_1886 [Shewanella violacea DSS12]
MSQSKKAFHLKGFFYGTSILLMSIMPTLTQYL